MIIFEKLNADPKLDVMSGIIFKPPLMPSVIIEVLLPKSPIVSTKPPKPSDIKFCPAVNVVDTAFISPWIESTNPFKFCTTLLPDSSIVSLFLDKTVAANPSAKTIFDLGLVTNSSPLLYTTLLASLALSSGFRESKSP